MANHHKREFLPHTAYHVYNRGVGRRAVFHDERDYAMFQAILRRLLCVDSGWDRNRNRIAPTVDQVNVMAYALMPNHFHLVIYQRDAAQALSELMRRSMISYTKYFNRRYSRTGKLWEGRFHAKLLADATAMRGAIIYVHANPATPLRAGTITSHELFMAGRPARNAHWCSADHGLKVFGSRAVYLEQLFSSISSRQKAVTAQRTATP